MKQDQSNNMRKSQMYLIFLLVLSFLISGCNTAQQEAEGCTPPPEGFSEDALIGTWYNGLDFRNDTIVFREDGFYKQFIHVESQSLDYESDWQKWWIEYTEIGIPYIHLEDMRLCVYWNGMDCSQVGGGEENWWDFCRDEIVQIPEEGVLMVLGVPERFNQPARGFNLASFEKSIHVIETYYFIGSQIDSK